MVMLMNHLPKTVQDTIKSAIQQNIRRSTSGKIFFINRKKILVIGNFFYIKLVYNII